MCYSCDTLVETHSSKSHLQIPKVHLQALETHPNTGNTSIHKNKNGLAFFGECIGVQNACKIQEMFFGKCLHGAFWGITFLGNMSSTISFSLSLLPSIFYGKFLSRHLLKDKFLKNIDRKRKRREKSTVPSGI